MKVSPKLLAASAACLVTIAGFEGYRSVAYNDGVGVQTVGYGTTRYASGKAVKAGDRITPDRALVELAANVATFEKEIRVCIGDVPLAQYEWDAFVSLAYNIGSARFCSSSVVRALKRTPPDYPAACRAILLYVKAGGKVLRGLERRREAEFYICTDGVYPDGYVAPQADELQDVEAADAP